MKLLRLDQAYPIDRLRPYPQNYRQHDLEALATALDRGQHRTVVVREETGEVLAGNGVYHVAMEKEWPTLAVSLVECDDEEAQEIVVSDNRSQERGREDVGLLAALLEQIDSRGRLEAVGYDKEYLDGLLDEINRPTAGAGDPDDVPAPPKEPITKRGDLWLLGEHGRVLCGDSLTVEVLDRLYGGVEVGVVLTDPPYGISLDTDYSKRENTSPGTMRSLLKNHPRRAYRPMVGDEGPFDAALLAEYFKAVAEQFWFGADYYRRTLSPEDRDGSWLVWDKRSPETDVVLGSGFELVWSKEPHKRDLLRHFWSGAFGSGAVDRVHPTQKPTKLLAEILERWAPKGCVVADPFAGSGSTLIAALQTGRRAHLADLDAQYVDVICRRYEEQSHQQPVLERTGEPHSFTAYEPVSSEEYGPALATAGAD